MRLTPSTADRGARRAPDGGVCTTSFLSGRRSAAISCASADSAAGGEAFAEGLYEFLHGRAGKERRFEQWCEVVGALPRRQTRVSTWPVVTVFGFIAQPDRHVFLKPNVTQAAAREYGVEFDYASRNWDTYASLLDFAARVMRDQRDLEPRDMIDAQSFIWLQGSDEYEE